MINGPHAVRGVLVPLLIVLNAVATDSRPSPENPNRVPSECAQVEQKPERATCR